MDLQKEREAFEDWYCKNHTGLKQSDLAKFRTLSGYSFSDSLKINISWEAWQAGAESRQAEIDELNKRIDDAMQYVSESPLKDVSRRAMLNFLDILKGKQND